MNTFGKTLRSFRQASNDPGRDNRRLSQSRLGELIGHEMGDRGVSGAAVSDWEHGKSKISAQDRNMLLALIKVLHQCEGISTLEDANQLLEAGDYRALNRKEAQGIFGDIADEANVKWPIPHPESSKSFPSFLLENLFSLSDSEIKALLAKAKKGPPPSWPRVLAALMRKGSERIFVSPKTILWFGVWLIAWRLTVPSLRWPFENHGVALQSIVMYGAGSLIVPLLIGMLIDTRNNEYWQGQGLANSTLLRLYTYQGAAIGYNLGYFIIFPAILASYYLGLGSFRLLEILAVTLSLILANMSARVVPHNLWVAYGRFSLADGRIFFVVALLGPLWGIFFLQYYSVLQTPLWGSIVILLALLLFVSIAARQSKSKA